MAQILERGVTDVNPPADSQKCVQNVGYQNTEGTRFGPIIHLK